MKRLALCLVAVEAFYCFGATGNDSSFCNSDVVSSPPIGIPYLMGIGRVTFATNATVPNTLYPAASIKFTATTPTRIRIWDMWVCGDYFQLNLSNNLIPVQMPQVTIPICNVWTPLNDADRPFRNNLYAWSELILEDPSTWTLNISVARYNPDSLLFFMGTVVQQFIETSPFVRPTICPF